MARSPWSLPSSARWVAMQRQSEISLVSKIILWSNQLLSWPGWIAKANSKPPQQKSTLGGLAKLWRTPCCEELVERLQSDLCGMLHPRFWRAILNGWRATHAQARASQPIRIGSRITNADPAAMNSNAPARETSHCCEIEKTGTKPASCQNTGRGSPSHSTTNKISQENLTPKLLPKTPQFNPLWLNSYFEISTICTNDYISVSGAPNKQALNNAFGIEPSDPYLHLSSKLGSKETWPPWIPGQILESINHGCLDSTIPTNYLSIWIPALQGLQAMIGRSVLRKLLIEWFQNFRYSMIFLYKYVLHWALFISLKSDRKIANKAKLAKTS